MLVRSLPCLEDDSLAVEDPLMAANIAIKLRWKKKRTAPLPDRAGIGGRVGRHEVEPIRTRLRIAVSPGKVADPASVGRETGIPFGPWSLDEWRELRDLARGPGRPFRTNRWKEIDLRRRRIEQAAARAGRANDTGLIGRPLERGQVMSSLGQRSSSPCRNLKDPELVGPIAVLDDDRGRDGRSGRQLLDGRRREKGEVAATRGPFHLLDGHRMTRQGEGLSSHLGGEQKDLAASRGVPIREKSDPSTVRSPSWVLVPPRMRGQTHQFARVVDHPEVCLEPIWLWLPVTANEDDPATVGGQLQITRPVQSDDRLRCQWLARLGQPGPSQQEHSQANQEPETTPPPPLGVSDAPFFALLTSSHLILPVCPVVVRKSPIHIQPSPMPDQRKPELSRALFVEGITNFFL